METDLKSIIVDQLKKKGRITSDQVSILAHVSRQAAHKHLAKLVKQKLILKIGKTRSSYYIPFTKKAARELAGEEVPLFLRLKSEGMQEDLVFDRIALTSKTLKALSKNAKSIFRYAFTEMLNNAIEHSKSTFIEINIFMDDPFAAFEIVDYGVGIFNNLIIKYKLKNELEAIQELLKGKRTTDPKRHSGEGIFFTSKISDLFEIEGAKTMLAMDNIRNDLFVKKTQKRKGTRVVFKINKNTKKDLTSLFNEYTDEDYKFSKTKVVVKLYEHEVDYVSRSQARRIFYGLEQFKTIILDFDKIKGIGQGFADEIFRVFKGEHPKIDIFSKNANNAVLFMLRRAGYRGNA